MISLIATLKGALVISAIAGSAALTGAAVDVIGENTPITLGGGIAVAGVVVTGAWYLSSRLQRIEDRLERIEVRCKQCGTK